LLLTQVIFLLKLAEEGKIEFWAGTHDFAGNNQDTLMAAQKIVFSIMIRERQIPAIEYVVIQKNSSSGISVDLEPVTTADCGGPERALIYPQRWN